MTTERALLYERRNSFNEQLQRSNELFAWMQQPTQDIPDLSDESIDRLAHLTGGASLEGVVAMVDKLDTAEKKRAIRLLVAGFDHEVIVKMVGEEILLDALRQFRELQTSVSESYGPAKRPETSINKARPTQSSLDVEGAAAITAGAHAELTRGYMSLGTAILSGELSLSAEQDNEDWQAKALCAQTDPEAFFPEKGGSTREAKKICLSCGVRDECLEYALDNDERFGIWGGLSERERRKLKKRMV